MLASWHGCEGSDFDTTAGGQDGAALGQSDGCIDAFRSDDRVAAEGEGGSGGSDSCAIDDGVAGIDEVGPQLGGRPSKPERGNG